MAYYTVIIGCGYVEDEHIARLIFNYETQHEGLTAEHVAHHLADALEGLFAANFDAESGEGKVKLKQCCRKAAADDRFCSKCGHELGDQDLTDEERLIGTQQLFCDMATMNCDQLSGRYPHIDLWEYMRAYGWEINGTLTSGPLLSISAFDRYLEDQESRAVEFVSQTIEIGLD